MNDRYISLAEFAKIAGVTRQAIYQHKDNGIFPVVEIDGKTKIDLHDRKVKQYLKDKSVTEPVKVSGPKKQEIRKVVEASKQETGEKEKPVRLKENEIPDYLKDIADSGNLTISQMMQLSKSEVDKIKVYEQIKSIRVKTAQQRKELISRKLVRIVFGKLYEIDMNEFLTVKNKVVPDLAGIFGCNDEEKMLAAEKRIDDELWKVLNHVKFELDRFLKSQGEETL